MRVRKGDTERKESESKMSEIDAKVNMSLGKSPESRRSNGSASNPG